MNCTCDILHGGTCLCNRCQFHLSLCAAQYLCGHFQRRVWPERNHNCQRVGRYFISWTNAWRLRDKRVCELLVFIHRLERRCLTQLTAPVSPLLAASCEIQRQWNYLPTKTYQFVFWTPQVGDHHLARGVLTKLGGGSLLLVTSQRADSLSCVFAHVIKVNMTVFMELPKNRNTKCHTEIKHNYRNSHTTQTLTGSIHTGIFFSYAQSYQRLSNKKKNKLEKNRLKKLLLLLGCTDVHNWCIFGRDDGRLESIPDDIRDGGGVHPGQANKSRTELHLQTESAAHLADTALRSGRRLKNWLRRKRENEERGHVRKIRVTCPSGSSPAMLPTISAHVTQMTIQCFRLIETWGVRPLRQLRFSSNAVPCFSPSVLKDLSCSIHLTQTHLPLNRFCPKPIWNAPRVSQADGENALLDPSPSSSYYPGNEALQSHPNTKVKVPRRGH